VERIVSDKLVENGNESEDQSLKMITSNTATSAKRDDAEK
jgi:hypothetical protein